MKKPDFYHILCTSSPEEINAFISSKGKKKMVNAITFITPESTDTDSITSTSSSPINLNMPSKS